MKGNITRHIVSVVHNEKHNLTSKISMHGHVEEGVTSRVLILARFWWFIQSNIGPEERVLHNQLRKKRYQ